MILIQEYFVPEKISEARKLTILRPAQAAVASAIRRQPSATSDEQSSGAPPCPPPLPACRDFSTWASNRDFWQWIQIFMLFVFCHFECAEAKCEYFANEMMKNHYFQINKSAGDDEPASLGL